MSQQQVPAHSLMSSLSMHYQKLLNTQPGGIPGILIAENLFWATLSNKQAIANRFRQLPLLVDGSGVRP